MNRTWTSLNFTKQNLCALRPIFDEHQLQFVRSVMKDEQRDDRANADPRWARVLADVQFVLEHDEFDKMNYGKVGSRFG